MKLSAIIAVRCEPREKRSIKAYAKRHKLSLSELLMAAIREKVANE